MAENLSRQEEQRGWRRAFLWMIPIALVFGTALLFVTPLMNWATEEEKQGMDEVATQGAPVERKQALGPAMIEVKSSAAYGQYLTDGSGHPLYLFKADSRGEAGRQAESKCYDDCVKSWPPLLSDGAPKGVSPARSELLGTVTREDGSTQVTYNGWPLYLFVRDLGPEDVTGHDLKDFGEEWYLVAPSGEEVHAEAKAEAERGCPLRFSGGRAARAVAAWRSARL